VNRVGRVLGTMGWLAFFVYLAQGCAALPADMPKVPDVPTVKPADARTAYKLSLTACIACQMPDLPKEAADACAELAPVCDALAGICKK
jgi:hypothetical protein